MNDKQKREVARDLYDKLIAYWHEVDFNWGRNAGEYYMEDAVFEGGNGSFAYNGVSEIREFYKWREERGARVSVHAINNFHCEFESDTLATASWICMLYAHDGEAPQASEPPIGIQKVVDQYVLADNGLWLCQRRTWHSLFAGGVPGTGLTPQQMAERRAGQSQ